MRESERETETKTEGARYRKRARKRERESKETNEAAQQELPPQSRSTRRNRRGYAGFSVSVRAMEAERSTGKRRTDTHRI